MNRSVYFLVFQDNTKEFFVFFDIYVETYIFIQNLRSICHIRSHREKQRWDHDKSNSSSSVYNSINNNNKKIRKRVDMGLGRPR